MFPILNFCSLAIDQLITKYSPSDTLKQGNRKRDHKSMKSNACCSDGTKKEMNLLYILKVCMIKTNVMTVKCVRVLFSKTVVTQEQIF